MTPIRVTICNFQAHERVKVNIASVATIVGASDRGKSAIVRAIRWACVNRPGGDAFVREGEDNARVIVSIDTNRVERAKGKAGNIYKLNGKRLEAFRGDIPPEVAAVLNVGDVNFQLQHDPPFWFSDTAGEVSRKLNEIINLGSIDSTLGFINSAIRQNNETVRVCGGRYAAAEADRAALASVTDADAELKRLEEQEREIKQTHQNAAGLASLLKGVSEHVQTIEHASKLTAAALDAIQKGEAWAGLQDQTASLSAAIGSAQTLAAQASDEVPSLSDVETTFEAWRVANVNAADFRDLLSDAKRLRSTAAAADAELSATAAEFRRKLGKTCPLCEAKIKP